MSEQTKWQPNAKQRAVLERLQNLVPVFGSQGKLCAGNFDFGPSVLSKVLDALEPDEAKGSYFDDIKDPEAKMLDIEEQVERLELRLARGLCQGKTKLMALTQVLAVGEAVEQAGNETECHRLVKYLARPGGGKTMLARWLEENKKARVVEARQAWTRSYYCFLTDVCGVLGVRLAGENNPSVIEDILIRFLTSKRLVLVIDEGEFFGKRTLDGIKLLLNKTKIVVVICSTVAAHAKWTRYFPDEAEQIQHRTCATIVLNTIAVDDAAGFYPAGQFEDKAAALQMIAERATAGGQFDLCRRVAKKLAGKTRVATSAGKPSVKWAINSALADMSREEAVES